MSTFIWAIILRLLGFAIFLALFLFAVEGGVRLGLILQGAKAEPKLVSEIIEVVSAKHNIDPLLVKAIIVVESRGNPYMIGSQGEVGLMQIHPRWHRNVTAEIRGNIELGVSYLAHVRERCRDRYPGLTWLVCYNNGPNRTVEDPANTKYYKKVMTVYEHLTNGQK